MTHNRDDEPELILPLPQGHRIPLVDQLQRIEDAAREAAKATYQHERATGGRP